MRTKQWGPLVHYHVWRRYGKRGHVWLVAYPKRPDDATNLHFASTQQASSWAQRHPRGVETMVRKCIEPCPLAAAYEDEEDGHHDPDADVVARILSGES